jgi:hypothetical protein
MCFRKHSAFFGMQEALEALRVENEALKKQNASLGTRESVLVAQDRVVKRLELRLRDAKSDSANWEEQVSCSGFLMQRCSEGVFALLQVKTLSSVISDQQKTLSVLRAPARQTERERQYEEKIAALEEQVSTRENDARKLRREKLELEEKLKEQEKAWKIEKERLSDGASSIQTHRDGQIEDLKARCFELQTENTELRARCPVGMAAALRLAQERVRTLERQVGELVAMGGARTGPSVYDLLCDMAECISKMGKDMKEVCFVWLRWRRGAADSPLLCRRPLTANSG